MGFVDATYKLDIRDWKDKSKKLVEKIEAECKNFTIMHYNELVLTKAQYDDLTKTINFYSFEGNKAKHYKTSKGFLMEVDVNDN